MFLCVGKPRKKMLIRAVDDEYVCYTDSKIIWATMCSTGEYLDCTNEVGSICEM
jgi:hypothetical protein